MSEAYNDALKDQLEGNIWSTLKQEATSMTKLEYATISADIVGIFDPTPASDGVGAVLSLAQGDILGAGLSIVGMIPYVGDLGKIGKIGKVAPKTGRALELMLTKSDELAGLAKTGAHFTMKQIATAREAAATRVRKAMLDAKKKTPNCQDCKKLVSPNGQKKELKMPASNSTRGKWVDANGNKIDQPADGNGTFRIDVRDKDGNITGTQDLVYKDGFPDYDPFLTGEKRHIRDMTGDVEKDAAEFKKLMRESNPNWRKPPRHTLHHFDDGTVGYVPSNVHNGVSHTGGRSITQNDLF